MSVGIAESALVNSMQPMNSSSSHLNSQNSSVLPHMHHSPGGSSHSSSSTLATTANISLPKITPEYLQELLKDKKNLQNLPNLFNHLDKILESEITRVRSHLFHFNGTKRPTDDLPEGEGPVVTVQEKVFIPVKDNPSYNFVGRLLGPRGMTAKQLETDLDCKIMIRGKGSMRDKKKEDQNRGKPNWEHLAEELHVLICVEDHQNRAELKVKRAAEEIKVFLEQAVKMPDGEDDLKKKQLMELPPRCSQPPPWRCRPTGPRRCCQPATPGCPCPLPQRHSSCACPLTTRLPLLQQPPLAVRPSSWGPAWPGACTVFTNSSSSNSSRRIITSSRRPPR